MTKSNAKWYVVLAKDNKSAKYRHVWWDGSSYDIALEKVTEAKNDKYEKFTDVKLVSIPSDVVEKALDMDGLQNHSDEILFKYVKKFM